MLQKQHRRIGSHPLLQHSGIERLNNSYGYMVSLRLAMPAPKLPHVEPDPGVSISHQYQLHCNGGRPKIDSCQLVGYQHMRSLNIFT